MPVYVFDENAVLQAVVDNYDSLEWSRKFLGVGDFNLTINRNLDNAKYFQKRYIVGTMYRGQFDRFFVLDEIENGISETGSAVEPIPNFLKTG